MTASQGQPLEKAPSNLEDTKMPSYLTTVPLWIRPKSPALTAMSKSSSNSPDGNARANDAGISLFAGCQADEVYKKLMPPWRYKLRKKLVKYLEWESPRLGSWQRAARAPFWDAYFLWSSILGTHSAFMMGLPIFWWFGYSTQGRGLVNILAVGVYLASFVKDLLCVPRPYSPPVERLSISSHGLEYGFPSTHSTNAVSISLYSAQMVIEAFKKQDSPVRISISMSVCMLYAVSVVTGRLYCGMHSFLDCVAGAFLGLGIWYTHYLVAPILETFLKQTGWIVPVIIIPLSLLAVSVHPDPADNCPCFEDAIAFIAVAVGVNLGQWGVYRASARCALATRGTKLLGTPWGILLWLSTCIAKIVVGITCILLWRIAAKTTLCAILPPIFRAFNPILNLPRRFYQPAKDYQEIEQGHPLQSIPSVLDLRDLGFRSLSEARPPINISSALHFKQGPGFTNMAATELANSRPSTFPPRKENADIASIWGVKLPLRQNGKELSGETFPSIHYDVDVLTKFGVYSGIGVVATTILPWIFEVIGLDV